MITLLTGENSYTIAQRVSSLKQAFNGESERFEGSDIQVMELADIFAGATLFASERLIFIYDASSNKVVWGELEKWASHVPEQTHVVLIEPNVDKRTRTYKTLTQHASSYEHALLDENALVMWLQSQARFLGSDINRQTAKYIVDYVGYDQWRLSSELEKLLLSGRPVDQELVHAICEPYPEASAFELLDCLFSGKYDRLESLLELLAEREDPYRFLGLLSSQLTALLAISSAGQRGMNDIARDLGLHPFVLKRLSSTAKSLGKKKIIAMIEKLAECDNTIKTTDIPPWEQLRRTMLAAASDA